MRRATVPARRSMPGVMKFMLGTSWVWMVPGNAVGSLAARSCRVLRVSRGNGENSPAGLGVKGAGGIRISVRDFVVAELHLEPVPLRRSCPGSSGRDRSPCPIAHQESTSSPAMISPCSDGNGARKIRRAGRGIRCTSRSSARDRRAGQGGHRRLPNWCGLPASIMPRSGRLRLLPWRVSRR